MTTLKSDIAPSSQADMAFGIGPITLAAPTAAEVNALTRVECWIPGDSPVSMTRSAVMASAKSACDDSSYDVPVGTVNDPVSFAIWRYIVGTGTDLAFDLFDDTVLPRPLNFWVDCPAGFSGAAGVAAATDVVDIYSVLIGSRSKAPRSGDALQRADITLSVVGLVPGIALV